MPEFQDYTFKLHTRGGHSTIFHLYRATTGDYPRYVQYVNTEGKWFILRESESGSVRTAEYYLPAATTTIDTDWTNRAGLTYGRYDEIF